MLFVSGTLHLAQCYKILLNSVRPVSWPSIWWTYHLPWKTICALHYWMESSRNIHLVKVVASVVQTCYVFTVLTILSVFDREVLNPPTETVELLPFPFHSVSFASHKVFPFVIFVYLMSWPLYHFESDHFLSIYKAYTETQTWRTCRPQDGKSRWDEWGKVGGMNGETGIDIHTLLFFFSNRLMYFKEIRKQK